MLLASKTLFYFLNLYWFYYMTSFWFRTIRLNQFVKWHYIDWVYYVNSKIETLDIIHGKRGSCGSNKTRDLLYCSVVPLVVISSRRLNVNFQSYRTNCLFDLENHIFTAFNPYWYPYTISLNMDNLTKWLNQWCEAKDNEINRRAKMALYRSPEAWAI